MESKCEKVKGLWTAASEVQQNIKKLNKDINNSSDSSKTNLTADQKKEAFENDFSKDSPFNINNKKRKKSLTSLRAKRKFWFYACTYKYNPPKFYNYFWFLISFTSALTVDINLGIGGRFYSVILKIQIFLEISARFEDIGAPINVFL